MRSRTILAVILAGLALPLTGCGGGAPVGARVPQAASGAPEASPKVPVAPSGWLTVRRARAAYLAIIDPVNRVGDALNTDQQDSAPIVRYRADLRATIAGLRAATRQLRATRWPARVQPYITAMAATDLAASIRCDRAQLRAGGYAAVSTLLVTNLDCTASQNTGNADTIRSMLHLPSLSG